MHIQMHTNMYNIDKRETSKVKQQSSNSMLMANATNITLYLCYYLTPLENIRVLDFFKPSISGDRVVCST